MLKILNKTRKVSGKMSVPKQIMTTFFALLFGGGMGIVAKFLDSNRLPSFFDWLDLSNFLGRTAPWIFIAVCLAVFSKSPLKAGINVFAFFAGMVASYYLYSNYVAGFFPRSYAMIWFGFTMISPFLAFVCWYAKGKSRPAFMLSVLILAVLFNMTFVYGWGYFKARSVLELIVFIIGLTVLRRDTLKSSVLMGTISIVFAFLLDMVIPFHFG